MKRHVLTAVAVALLSQAVAAPVTVNLGGQPMTLNTTVIGGVTYIKLADLQKALAQGGANQKSSVSGCMNEWLFNGVWRMRVTDLQVVTDDSRGGWPGYAVTVELRNGTTQTLSPEDGGIKSGGVISLATRTGNQYRYEYKSDWVDVAFAKVLQGSGFTFTYKIWPDPQQTVEALKANMPSKLLFEVVKPVNNPKLQFSVPDPSFRVELTCKK